MNLKAVEDVVALLKTSLSPEIWADNLKLIRDANGGDYPDFWYEAVVRSGLIDRICMKWDIEGEPASSFKRSESSTGTRDKNARQIPRKRF